MPWVCSWNARHFKHKCRAFSWQTHGISGVNSRYFGSKPAVFRKRTLQDSKIAFFTLQTDQYLYWLVLLYLYILYISLAVILPVKLPAILPQNHTSSPFSVAELLSVIFTFTKSPTRCVPLSKTTTRFCSVRPKSWSRERLDTPSTNTS